MKGSPPNRTLFIDINTGGRGFREMVSSTLGVRIVLHDEHFGKPSPGEKSPEDNEWLVTIGKLGWLIVTSDKRCLREPLFIRDIGRSAAFVFVLGDMNGKTREQRAALIIEAYPKMLGLIEGATRPSIWLFEGGKISEFDWRERFARYCQWGRITKR
jgi:hypothetical protein